MAVPGEGLVQGEVDAVDAAPALPEGRLPVAGAALLCDVFTKQVGGCRDASC
jgi:hypothetical protein